MYAITSSHSRAEMMISEAPVNVSLLESARRTDPRRQMTESPNVWTVAFTVKTLADSSKKAEQRKP